MLLWEVAFQWKLTKQTIDLPLGCLQGAGVVGGVLMERVHCAPQLREHLACTGLGFSAWVCGWRVDGL